MEQVLTLDKPDKILKIVSAKKNKNVFFPQRTKQRNLRELIYLFFNKANGIIVDKPTIEEIKQRSKQVKKDFRELHKTSYNLYMSNLMKNKNKNDEAYRLKEKERGRLRWIKQREAKLLETTETTKTI